MRNNIIPGTKKLLKGECSKIEIGKPPINFPEGEIIKDPPPPIELKERNANKIIRIFLDDFVFINFKIYLISDLPLFWNSAKKLF